MEEVASNASGESRIVLLDPDATEKSFIMQPEVKVESEKTKGEQELLEIQKQLKATLSGDFIIPDMNLSPGNPTTLVVCYRAPSTKVLKIHPRNDGSRNGKLKAEVYSFIPRNVLDELMSALEKATGLKRPEIGRF